ncbi:MAG: DDE-type integrase/transposase/recombinase [Acidobacteria bacterium]|nr:DDE-type integrase/transposase/recombinase [Acidobacteriota bacterium]
MRDEVLRVKAWLPEAGCRKIAATFNHLHETRRGITVSKIYVAELVRRNQEEILRKRRGLRRRRPRRMPRNIVWGLDLTYLPGGGNREAALGILDHGSRACLALRRLTDKSTVSVLRALLDVVENFGKPKVLRTDNEATFRSRLFRFVLWALGIRPQRTAPFAPWQNGRIERFFGTVKPILRTRFGDRSAQPITQKDLDLVRTWYNHLRLHQNLEGLTPAEAWSGMVLDRRRKPVWVSEWDGLLSAYFWPMR